MRATRTTGEGAEDQSVVLIVAHHGRSLRRAGGSCHPAPGRRRSGLLHLAPGRRRSRLGSPCFQGSSGHGWVYFASGDPVATLKCILVHGNRIKPMKTNYIDEPDQDKSKDKKTIRPNRNKSKTQSTTNANQSNQWKPIR